MSEKEFLDRVNNSKDVIHKACTIYCESYPREDLIQEILLELWLSIDSFKKNCSFTTWAYYIAKNTCIDILRKQKKAPDIVGLDEYANVLAETNNEPELVKQLREAMRYEMVIDSLEEPQKTLFKLHVEGLSYKEISLQLSIDENLLRQWMHRIKKRLSLRYGKK